MKHLSPKLITVMKYLGTYGEYRFVMADDIMFPSLEDRLNYLSQLEYKLWANGELSSIYGRECRVIARRIIEMTLINEN